MNSINLLQLKDKFLLPLFSLFILTGFILVGCNNQPTGEGKDFQSGFLNPPASAKPRVWWHWMNGNITKEGVKADLEWMHRIGIGGFQNFDAALMTPQIVEKRLVYMTPEWKDAFSFTTKLADSLGLEMAIAGSPGWSESGGPWVKPEQAMKKFVWSETRIEGGKPFSGFLPKPPSTTGPIQNLPLREGFSLTGTKEEAPKQYYADAAVIAYKIPDNDESLASLKPVLTSSGGKFNINQLTDGDLLTTVLLPYTKPGENAWIQYGFSKPETFSSLTIVGGGSQGTFGFGADPDNRALESSDDGKTYTKVTDIKAGPVEQRTITFAPVTARYFRFTWKTPEPRPVFNIGAALGLDGLSMPEPPKGTNIAELVLNKVSRVNHFEDKAAFAAAADIYSFPTPAINENDAVKKTDVVDLTASMKPDGTLEWTPPAGNWMVLRLGYSLTGHKNSPASPEATGLEVDKLNADYVKTYFTNYLDQYKDATKGLMGPKGLHYIITDSWEAGTQNWTDNMRAEFAKRRGYDMTPWLPVLTGHIVESSQSSDKFLWDFRKTLADLVAENHYDQLTDILKERGMERYSESHESGRALIADGMDVKRKAAIPMSATWTPGGLDPGSEVATRYKADVRESASTAHIYGQNLVAAESMTAIGSAWAWSPELLKPTADMELANGLNRFVIHTSVHQPVNDKIPGLGLGPFGQWFTRHETWAEQAGPWIDYLARSSYMLQQGVFVADIVYYYGEDNNITALFGEKLPDIPEGYSYDFINSDALLNLLTVKNGLLSTPSGMTYKVLALDANSRYMPLPVLKKINDLVKAGAIVIGEKPLASPSLTDDQNEFKSIADALWLDEKGEIKTGTGKVLAGVSFPDALKTLNLTPDFSYTKPENDSKLLFVHRQAGDINFYWVNNRQSKAVLIDASFRISGKQAELWHPETGKIENSSYTFENGITKVPLHLQPNDAVFVVFRNKTGKSTFTIPEPVENELATVNGPWIVSFQENRGAPEKATFESLSPWNENADNGIKYFSGTATYSKSITADQSWFANGKVLCLDLGGVMNLAEVLVNGKSLGIVWKKPFRIDITSALKPGENTLDIKVTNLWVNRLIGDQQPGVQKKMTYTTMPFYQAGSPLKQSGLLGPVKILSVTNN
jgi:hypothetical protein